jgi:hypothetical protein
MPCLLLLWIYFHFKFVSIRLAMMTFEPKFLALCIEKFHHPIIELKSYTTKECLFCNYVVHSPLSSTINLFHLHTKCHHVLFVPHLVCHNLKIVPSLPHPIHTIDIISSPITLSPHHHHATTLLQHHKP